MQSDVIYELCDFFETPEIVARSSSYDRLKDIARGYIEEHKAAHKEVSLILYKLEENGERKFITMWSED